jgi:hypothetical protein
MQLRSTCRRAPRRGAALAQAVLSLIVLLAIAAVALDGGLLVAQRRRIQGAADAAALAAAADLFKNWNTGHGLDSGGTAAKSAKTASSANGYADDGGVTTSVTVHIPPTSGDHVGQAGYAEVIVTHNQVRFFSSIWGKSNIPVSARAVARGLLAAGTASPSNNIGMLVLGTTSGVVSENGNVGIDMPGRTFAVESTNNAFSTAGSNAELTAGKFVFAANNTPAQLGNPPVLNGPSPTYSTPTADPLSGLAAPSTSGLLSQTYGGGSVTINPGIYTGVLNIGNSNVTMNPGIYYLKPDAGGNAGITMSGNGSLDGTSGVFIYVAPPAVAGTGFMNLTNNGTGAISLNPINAGTYKGISIYVDRAWATANTNLELGGTPGANIYGTVYAPSSSLILHGTPNANTGSQLIVDTVTVKGNAHVNAGSGPQAGQSVAFQLVE